MDNLKVAISILLVLVIGVFVFPIIAGIFMFLIGVVAILVCILYLYTRFSAKTILKEEEIKQEHETIKKEAIDVEFTEREED